MKAHLNDTHLLVSRSSAKVKVKYQGHVSQKMGVSGGISVSQTHLVFFLMTVKLPELLSQMNMEEHKVGVLVKLLKQFIM